MTPPAANPGMAERILVVSPNWIGDAVMAQPLLQRLRSRYPACLIDVLSPPSAAPVWRAMAEVDTVLEAPLRRRALQLRERWQYARLLRARGYASAYVLPNSFKYALIPWLAGIPERIGYKGEMRYGLINTVHHDDNPRRPMVAFYAALAERPRAPLAPAPRPRLGASRQQIDAACARTGVKPGDALVVFAPGAEFGAAKRWPPAHFAALAKSILERDPLAQVALLGSPKDRETCDQIVAIFKADGGAGAGAGRICNLAGATTLDEAIALIARAAAVVANDSGLLHIASALNRPVIALYGPTDPAHAPPLADVARAMSLRLTCSPCGKRECPLGHHDCLQKMAPEMVWRELLPMVSAAPP